jgi:hypothetical protein
VDNHDIEKEGGGIDEDEDDKEFDDIGLGHMTNKYLKDDKNKDIPKQDDNDDADIIEDEINKSIKATDSCICFKILFLVLSFITCLAAILYVGIMSTKISFSQTCAIVIAWLVAVIGGWFGLNVLRILSNAMFASYIVKHELQVSEHIRIVSRVAYIIDFLFVS